MNKLLKYLILPCLAISGVSCLKQGDALCDSYVRFEYDYNIHDVDLFYKQASRIDLFMFDGEGVYLGIISAQSDGATFDRDYRMRLPEGLGQDTEFIAWSGLYPDSFNHTQLTPGTSTMSDLIVALNASAGSQSDKNLASLWFGKLEGGLIKYENEVNCIKLMKNTNNIRIVLDPRDSEASLDVADFAFSFTAKNNSYDYKNAVADQSERTYVPFEAKNDVGSGTVVVEISTLRLLENNDNHLLITYSGQVTPVLDVDLTPYLNALKPHKHTNMPLQEYLDREDEYNIIVFLSRETEAGAGKWLSTKITTLEWIDREQEM